MSLRVLHVITRLTLGGSAENTVGSMLGLAAAGYDTSLAVGLAESDAASIDMTIENIPSENPKTGRITALSVIATLRKLHAPLRVGT